jgi:hypothetical protein
MVVILVSEMNNEIYQERKKIAYRLCGTLISVEEISTATKLSIEEVQELKKQRDDDYTRRRKINPLYNGDMELDESDAQTKLKSIWTKYHERGAIKMMKENLEHLNMMINEETDTDKKKRFEEHRDKMERELEERERNLYE